MKLLRALLPAAIALTAAAPVSADAPTPQQIRKFLADYGKCITKREPELARKAVLTGADFSIKSDEGKRLLQRECVDLEELRNTSSGFRGKLRMGEDDYRGTIADALIARDAAQLAASDFSAVPALTYEEPRPLKMNFSDGKPIPEERLARQRVAIERKLVANRLGKLGECVVRTAAAPSRAVLATPIDSSAELQALQGVTPALQQCLPVGETAAFDRMSLRGTLAVAYYRLASAAQTSGAVK